MMLVVSRVQRAIMGLSTGSGRLPSSAWISTAAVTAEKGASWKLAPMAFVSPTVVKVVGATLVGILAVLCLALFLAGNALIRGIQSGAERSDSENWIRLYNVGLVIRSCVVSTGAATPRYPSAKR